MRVRAVVICSAFALLLNEGVFPAMIRRDRPTGAFMAENETGVAEEGTSGLQKKKESSAPSPSHYQDAPYPQTPVGEERLKELKQLHRDQR